MHPEGYQCFVAGCRTKYVCLTRDPASYGLTRAGFPRIKRRSAFMKHVKAKHDIDLSRVPFEEAAAAANLIRVSPDAERTATPPPDYTTASMEPMYKEEDLPTFSSDAMPKEEVHTPPSVVTPPPPVIDVVPSSEGYKWSSTGFVGTFSSPDHIVCPIVDLMCYVQTPQHLTLASSAVLQAQRYWLTCNPVLSPRCLTWIASSIRVSFPTNPPHITSNSGPRPPQFSLHPPTQSPLSLRSICSALPSRGAFQARTTHLGMTRTITERLAPRSRP